MNLSNLKPAKGSTHNSKRVGRGEGSGKGGTSKKGNKGAQSRAGYSRKSGFEGGQMPLQRRVPKFGFTPLNRVEFTPINLEILSKIATEEQITEINPSVLVAHGLASKNDKIKILGRGELDAQVNVSSHAFSKSAIEAIEAKGGTATKL